MTVHQPARFLFALAVFAAGCADPRTSENGWQVADTSSSGPTDAASDPVDAHLGAAEEDASSGATSSDQRDAARPPDAGSEPIPPSYMLDCGPSGIVLESAGPPINRVNYVIVGDGYTESELESTYRAHLETMLRAHFADSSEVFVRYRKFVNICALRTPSPRSGIGTEPGDSAFGGYGNDQTRLGYVDDDRIRAAVTALAPQDMEVDWTAVVLNADRWWNAGGAIMVWSGGHPDAGLAAIHEGGHSFFRLADEYGGECSFRGDETNMRINVTKDPQGTAGKWQKWFGFDHTPGTGNQGVFEGAEYCDRGAYRSTQDSVMNSLWRSPYFNAISREQVVRTLYDIVDPIDDATPPSTVRAATLEVHVVDPAVIEVEWYVDDDTVPVSTGGRFDTRALPSGKHLVRARAVDRTEWVRGERQTLEQSLSWNLEVP